MDHRKHHNWKSWLDEQVERLIGDGATDHLPGAGRPLDLEEDSNIPPEERLARRIMKDNDLPPAWVLLKQELDGERAALLHRLENYARDYGARLAEARRRNSLILEREADERWQRAGHKLRQDMETYNRKLLTYNVSAPPPFNQAIPLNVAEEMRGAARFYQPG
ncbi:MAG: DUF1992 domain-containing protein [Anaerolineae bacterium]|nr:DUF1992 domain-containing protein [Anaerolineae bacterium]